MALVTTVRRTQYDRPSQQQLSFFRNYFNVSSISFSWKNVVLFDKIRHHYWRNTKYADGRGVVSSSESHCVYNSAMSASGLTGSAI